MIPSRPQQEIILVLHNRWMELSPSLINTILSFKRDKKLLIFIYNNLVKMCARSVRCWLWQYGLWSFQTGDTKLERFLPKNQILNGNYWILSFGLTASCQKVPTFDFRSQFSMLKIIRIFLIFFSLKNIN